MGIWNRDGIGGEKNVPAALMWFSIAAEPVAAKWYMGSGVEDRYKQDVQSVQLMKDLYASLGDQGAEEGRKAKIMLNLWKKNRIKIYAEKKLSPAEYTKFAADYDRVENNQAEMNKLLNWLRTHK
jgi:TPR repeat protein